MGYRFYPKDHVHTLDDQPLIGTTTALSVLSKELTWWASGMACSKFGWLHTKKNKAEDCLRAAEEAFDRIKKMNLNDYILLLGEAYKAHNEKKKDSADKGIDMHSLLEDYIKGELVRDFQGQEIGFLMENERIKPFVKWTKTHVKRFLFSELYCYSTVLWVGGICDFGYEDLEGNYVLGDFKSSEAAYFNHWAQTGGYDLQISENGGFTENGQKVFILDKPFKYHAVFAERAGLDKPFFNHDIDRTKRAFAYAANLYKEKMFFEEKK